MQVIHQEKGTGKTTELIKRAAKDGLWLVCSSSQAARALINRAKDLGLEILFPLTFDEFLEGTFYNVKGFLIDDVDGLLTRISRDVPIEAITLTAQGKPIFFNWLRKGENCGEPVLVADVFDYHLQVYKAHGSKLWSYRVNSMGCMNISTQEEAINQVQHFVTGLIINRVYKAKKDLALLTDFAFIDRDQEHDYAYHSIKQC